MSFIEIIKKIWEFLKTNTYLIWTAIIGVLYTLLKFKNKKIEGLNKDLKTSEKKVDDLIEVNQENKEILDKKLQDDLLLKEINRQIKEERQKQGLPNINLNDKDEIDLGKWGQP